MNILWSPSKKKKIGDLIVELLLKKRPENIAFWLAKNGFSPVIKSPKGYKGSNSILVDFYEEKLCSIPRWPHNRSMESTRDEVFINLASYLGQSKKTEQLWVMLDKDFAERMLVLGFCPETPDAPA